MKRQFEVLDSKLASILKKIINGDLKRRVLIEEVESAQKETLSHGKTGRRDDLRVLTSKSPTQTNPFLTSIRF